MSALFPGQKTKPDIPLAPFPAGCLTDDIVTVHPLQGPAPLYFLFFWGRLLRVFLMAAELTAVKSLAACAVVTIHSSLEFISFNSLECCGCGGFHPGFCVRGESGKIRSDILPEWHHGNLMQEI